MRITINGLKIFVAAFVALPLLVALLLNSVSAQDSGAGGTTTDAAATYAAKCKMCHGLKAEKLFDPSKPDDELVQVVLKGKQAQRPPNMPAFETKGITAFPQKI